METATSRVDRAWRASHEGRPLPAGLRERLEGALGADLSAVRLHTGTAADAAARAFGADAVATGSAVFFRAGSYRPDDADGMRLLAHEVAHTVQQAGGSGAVRRPEPDSAGADRAEAEADRFADAFVAGTAPNAATGTRARVRVPAGPSGHVQRHASFEHRYLGDGKPRDLYEIAVRGPQRAALLQNQIRLMNLWRTGDPSKVTAEMVKNVDRDLEVVLLGPDKVVATLGEINALPDYLANPDTIDATGSEVLLGVLQLIRQESYNKFVWMATGTNPDVQFPLSPYKPTGWSLVDNIVETQSLDVLTSGLGPAGQDHYRGLLARNACHFAPYSWHRWSAANIIARDRARQSYQAKDPGAKAELRRQALNFAGYGDHFLEDSFAAGHLIDKTLVMQWFVEWAGDSDLVADHAILRYMTAALQPGLAAGKLYDPAYAGPSHDPQTVQELRDIALRVSGAGTRPGREQGRLRGYLDYLTFVTSAVAQLATAELHDHYNAGSLWVASAAQPTPYRIWGDDTLFTGQDGGPGVLATASTAELSRRAVYDILNGGGTGITPEQIRSHFPTRVGSVQTSTAPLRDWATGQKGWVEANIFAVFWDEIKDLLGRMVTPRLGIVSRDEPLGEQWYAGVGETIVDHQVAVLPADGRVFTASGGYAYEIDAVTGARIKNAIVELPHVGVDTASTLAMDATHVYVGISGHVHALPRHGAWTGKVSWSSPRLGGTDPLQHPVNLLIQNGRLFAACHGYVYELNTKTGTVKEWAELGDRLSDAAYPVDLATDGRMLFAGTHGFAYGLLLSEPWHNHKWHWDSKRLDNFLVYQPVAVMVHDGRLFAASNGWAYELSPTTGATIKEIQFVKAGVSSYYAHLTTDGGQLYIGSHGRAYALPVNGPWGGKALWESERLSVLIDHAPVTVLYLDDRLLAACDGYLYELDLLDGRINQDWLITTALAVGLDFTMALTVSGPNLYAGLHGYAYGILLTNLEPAPAAAWQLAEPTGTTHVPDRRGIHPATAKNITWSPVSALEGCAVLNGRNSSIDTTRGVVDTAPGRGYTVSAWVRLDSLPVAATAPVVSQSGRFVSAFNLGYSLGTSSWVFEHARADVSGAYIDRLPCKVAATTRLWTHVAAVYDPDALTETGAKVTEMRIYVDGKRQAAMRVDPGHAFATTGPLQIGAARYNAAADGWLNGAVRDVRVYDRALSDLQLEPQGTAFWRLDDGSGSVARDVRHAHDAVATGVRWENVTGVGGCATLDGKTSGIATKKPVIHCGFGGSFTVAAWVRVNASASGTWANLVGQDGTAVPAFALQFIGTGSNSGRWSFVRYTADRSGAPLVGLDSGVTVSAGTWTHVAGVYDAADGIMNIYINGSLRRTGPYNRTATWDANGPLTIGYSRYGNVAGDRLAGTVRDVRAYNQALSAEQVKNLLDDTGLGE